MCGKKKYIKNDKLRHLEIPHYSTLTVKEIYSFIGDHPDTHIYYPDAKEVPRLPRQWLCNVAYSLLGDIFSNWVKDKIVDHNQKIITDQDLMINMDPEVYAAFLASTAVSSKYNDALEALTLILSL